jgi:hypothetical protein
MKKDMAIIGAGQPLLKKANVMQGGTPEPLASALQKMISEYEAEKKKAFEKMQSNKHKPQMHSWYEAYEHAHSLFLKSLAKLKRLADANGA